MAFKIFMMAAALIAPLMMAVMGRVFMAHPPKTINAVYGYRTTRSMRNEDTWAFAHAHCGRIWFTCGVIFTALTAILLALSFKRSETSFGVLAAALSVLCVVGMVWAVLLTEKALKETFDENGERRPPAGLDNPTGDTGVSEESADGDQEDAEDDFGNLDEDDFLNPAAEDDLPVIPDTVVVFEEDDIFGE